MALTAALSTSMFNLSQDPTFQNRVMSIADQQCIVVGEENPLTVPFHKERQAYAAQVINNPLGFKNLLSIAVATDVGVIGDATQNSTVDVTPANALTQAALVQDVHILGAIQGQFNTYFPAP